MSFIIYPPNSPYIMQLGSYPIRYYGVIMAVAFALGVFICYFLFKKKFFKAYADTFFDLSPILILFSLFGARLFYVIGSYKYYLYNPMEILLINHGGLSIYGAIFFGLIAILYYSKVNKTNFLSNCDVLAVSLPLCQSIGRFGNYFNQEAYGAPYDGLVKLFVDVNHRTYQNMNIDYYHPTFLYESILDLIIFLVLLKVFNTKKEIKPGVIACLYLILYSFCRYFIEGIRIDSVLNINSIPIARIISIFIFIIAIFMLIFIKLKRT